MSAITIVAPTGVLARIEMTIPSDAQQTDSAAAQTVTERKLLNTRIAERAGKMTKAEIKREPTKFMAITIITAMMTAIIKLYAPALVPVARAKFSSKVTEKIL